MATITDTLKTEFYDKLPAQMSNQVVLSFLGSFMFEALATAGDYEIDYLTNPLLAGATGAMLALISGATEPVLKQCFQENSAAFWAAKCVISIGATTVLAPAFASLFGVTLKVQVLWTAIIAIVQLTRRAWNDGIAMNCNNSPIFFASITTDVVLPDVFANG